LRILVTNDDGVKAPGLKALVKAFAREAEVYVVAPERPQSACSHAVTLHKPLRVQLHQEAWGVKFLTANGTPADCVIIGLNLVQELDLVLSGLNAGSNLGEDVIYSGTVAAAREAALHHLPGLALSVAPGEPCDWSLAAEYTRSLVEKLAPLSDWDSLCLNVNFPPMAGEAPKGLKVARPGRRNYPTSVEKRIDPRGQPYYWLGSERPADDAPEGSDVWCVQEGYIAVTPLALETVEEASLELLRKRLGV